MRNNKMERPVVFPIIMLISLAWLDSGSYFLLLILSLIFNISVFERKEGFCNWGISVIGGVCDICAGTL